MNKLTYVQLTENLGSRNCWATKGLPAIVARQRREDSDYAGNTLFIPDRKHTSGFGGWCGSKEGWTGVLGSTYFVVFGKNSWRYNVISKEKFDVLFHDLVDNRHRCIVPEMGRGLTNRLGDFPRKKVSL